MQKVIISLLFLLSIFWVAFANNAKGKAIYEKYCQTCHNASTAPLMKSPQAFDERVWKEKFAAAEALAKKEPKKYENAMAVLVATVKTGKGAMVPGGMCQDESTPDKKCIDADYIAAIKYMSKPQ